MKQENRIMIISEFANKFEINAKIPRSFDSIPVLNNLNATFYYFRDSEGRNEDDIDNLWALFESALLYAQNSSPDNKAKLEKYFDLAVNIKGNGNSKITMGLYWIAPDVYLNLDSRNSWYIFESGKIPKNIVIHLPTISNKVAASTYFDLIEKLRAYLSSSKSNLSNFIELSFEAWRHSEEVNKQKKAQSARDSKGAALADDGVDSVHYWIYSPGDNASKWDDYYNAGIMAIGWDIGDLKTFPTKESMKQQMRDFYDPSKTYKNAAHATWQFANEMKPGDIIFAKKGMFLIVGQIGRAHV